MKKEFFWKLARPDGWDFYTSKTINYRESIGRIVKCPRYNSRGDLCSESFIHASRTPEKCFIGARIPCSVFRVRGIPSEEDNDKAGFDELYVVKEYSPEEVFEWNYKEAVNPINPLKINVEKVTEEHKRLLRNWILVRDSVAASVGASVGASVWDSVGASVWAPVRVPVWASVWAMIGDSVGDSVWVPVGAPVWASVWAMVRDSLGDSVWDSVGASVWDSVGAYVGSLFSIKRKDWRYTEKIECAGYPFQPAVDLWKMGLVSSYDGKVWRLHGGEKAGILYDSMWASQ